MSDTSGTSTPPAAAPAAPAEGGSGPETTSTTSTSTEGQQSSGGNPAWDTYRSKLGPSFRLIEGDLAEQDRLAQQRVEAANAKAKQYEDLGSIDDLRNARALATQLNDDPKGVYERLAGWLRANGQLEEAAAMQQAADAEPDADGDDEDEDPRIKELREGQERIQGFLSEQQRAQAIAQAQSQYEATMQDIRGKNGWMSDDDAAEIVRRALGDAIANESEPDLQKAADEYIGLRTRFLSTPRPGDSAPRLVPSGGTAPARDSNFDFTKAGKQDRQSYIAEILRNSKE